MQRYKGFFNFPNVRLKSFNFYFAKLYNNNTLTTYKYHANNNNIWICQNRVVSLCHC